MFNSINYQRLKNTLFSKDLYTCYDFIPFGVKIMKVEDIKKLTQKAKEAVEGLEEPLKTEGFKVILNKLMESGKNDSSRTVEIKKKKKAIASTAVDVTGVVEEVCNKINRTNYVEIYNMKKTLDKALFILKIVRDEAGVDGLLPLQISRILNVAFKIKATSIAISMALSSATKYVDRKQVDTRGGKGYKYYLMHEGEKYLEDLTKGDENE